MEDPWLRALRMFGINRPEVNRQHSKRGIREVGMVAFRGRSGGRCDGAGMWGGHEPPEAIDERGCERRRLRCRANDRHAGCNVDSGQCGVPGTAADAPRHTRSSVRSRAVQAAERRRGRLAEQDRPPVPLQRIQEHHLGSLGGHSAHRPPRLRVPHVAPVRRPVEGHLIRLGSQPGIVSHPFTSMAPRSGACPFRGRPLWTCLAVNRAQSGWPAP